MRSLGLIWTVAAAMLVCWQRQRVWAFLRSLWSRPASTRASDEQRQGTQGSGAESSSRDLVLGRRSAADDTEEVFESTDALNGDTLSRPRQPSKRAEDVWCTVFCPSRCAAGDTVMVQVFAHLEGQSGIARAAAHERDETTTFRATAELNEPIGRGEELSFVLSIADAIVKPPLRTMRWRGVPAAVQFAVTTPHSTAATALIGTVYITQGGVPFGEVTFRVGLVDNADVSRPVQPARQGAFRRYHRAFVSYASEDRVEVLKRVQMLSRLSIRYFHDLVSLEPGNRWADRIREEIDGSDVFYLFWSRHAAESRWVMEEVSYALARKGGDDSALPAIVPIPIEGPPLVPPPAELKHLHFNDAFLYFIKGSA